MRVRVSGVWKDNNLVSVRVSAMWRAVSYMWVNVAGVWRQFYRNPQLMYVGTLGMATFNWLGTQYYGYNEGYTPYNIPQVGSRNPTTTKQGIEVALIQTDNGTAEAAGGPFLHVAIGLRGNNAYAIPKLYWGGVWGTFYSRAYNDLTNFTNYSYTMSGAVPVSGNQPIWF